MSASINTGNYFGVPLYEVDIPEFEDYQDDLVEYFMDLRNRDPGVDRSNHGGWHSRSDLHRDPDPDVQWMASNLFKFSNTAIRHASENLRIGKVVMHDMWVNINEAGNWNAPHIHLPCIWSGVFYVKVPEDPKRDGSVAHEGDLLLINPLPLGYEHNRKQTMNYTPTNGRMILFPSHLLHMVCPHSDDEARISVAFNFMVEYDYSAR